MFEEDGGVSPNGDRTTKKVGFKGMDVDMNSEAFIDSKWWYDC